MSEMTLSAPGSGPFVIRPGSLIYRYIVTNGPGTGRDGLDIQELEVVAIHRSKVTVRRPNRVDGEADFRIDAGGIAGLVWWEVGS